MISPRSNRLNPRTDDHHVDKEYQWVECFFNNIKHDRRIFLRYEKTTKNFMVFLHRMSFLIGTRCNVNRT